MPERRKRLLSIVVPVLNEEDNVGPCYEAVVRVMDSLSDRLDYELIFTDNHSTDRTFEGLERLARRDPRIRVLRFSRNVGHQRSIYTGYTHAKGDAAVQLDCDLQDPPELIPEFVRLWEAGYKVVYGIRRSRQEGWWINSQRAAFYWLIDRLSEERLPREAGDFRLLDRRVLDELKKIDDHQPYLRGTIATMGFDQIGVPYDRRERARGTTKFSWSELICLGVDGILNHSVVPLRLATYTGLLVSMVTFLALFGYLVGRLFFGRNWPAGFATTTVLILLSLSLNALFLGILGEYLARIYRQVKKRSPAIIESELRASMAADVEQVGV